MTATFPHTLSGLAPGFRLAPVGLLDDNFNIRPWQKLLGQVAAASLAYFYGGVHITGLAGYPVPGYAGAILTIFFLLACTNAFNLIDAVDGLAAGVGLFATLTTLIAALQSQNSAAWRSGCAT